MTLGQLLNRLQYYPKTANVEFSAMDIDYVIMTSNVEIGYDESANKVHVVVIKR